MIEYDLSKMKLLAQGGEANIYEIDKDKILRVVYRKNEKKDKVEELIYPFLEQKGIQVPHIFRYLEIDNQQAQVMERVMGDTLLAEWIKKPFGAKKQTYEFSKIQNDILRLKYDDSILSLTDMMNYFVNNRQIDLDIKIINKVMGILHNLPAEKSLCHGDFHPGNILVSKQKKFVIDWSGAHIGNPISDVAHTYLLMSYAPKVPGQSRIEHYIISTFGRRRAKTYKKMMQELLGFEDKEFENWIVVMSLFRIYCGLPSEKMERIRFLLKWSEKV